MSSVTGCHPTWTWSRHSSPRCPSRWSPRPPRTSPRGRGGRRRTWSGERAEPARLSPRKRPGPRSIERMWNVWVNVFRQHAATASPRVIARVRAVKVPWCSGTPSGVFATITDTRPQPGVRGVGTRGVPDPPGRRAPKDAQQLPGRGWAVRASFRVSGVDEGPVGPDVQGNVRGTNPQGCSSVQSGSPHVMTAVSANNSRPAMAYSRHL